MENHFEFILKATGVVTSPNHPDLYPDNLDKTQTIEVESGKILRLEFTHFVVQVCGNINSCPCDYVKITDGDGTTLMDNSCGYSSSDPSSSSYFLPPIITTRSNRVEIFFHTNGRYTTSGWSLSWSAVTPGEKALMLNSIKISHHSPSKHLKGRSVPRVSQVFLTTRDFVVFLFLDTFRIQFGVPCESGFFNRKGFCCF